MTAADDRGGRLELAERRNWLIYDTRSECYWGPNRGGYWKSIANAGLYTEQEAREAEDFAKRYQRGEKAVPLAEHREAIDRLHAALSTTGGAQEPATAYCARCEQVVDTELCLSHHQMAAPFERVLCPGSAQRLHGPTFTEAAAKHAE